MSDAHLRIHQPTEAPGHAGAAGDSGDDGPGAPHAPQSPQSPGTQDEAAAGWKVHPINIRVSIPLGFTRWYFTLVGGPERRDPQRREIERRRHPLFTLGNLVFLFVVGTVIGVAAAVLMINGAVQLLDGSYSVVTP